MVVKVLIEGVVVGICTLVLGYIFGYLINEIVLRFRKNDSTTHLYVMAIALFFTGFFFHILCEIAGLNRWYCKEYVKSM